MKTNRLSSVTFAQILITGTIVANDNVKTQKISLCKTKMALQ